MPRVPGVTEDEQKGLSSFVPSCPHCGARWCSSHVTKVIREPGTRRNERTFGMCESFHQHAQGHSKTTHPHPKQECVEIYGLGQRCLFKSWGNRTAWHSPGPPSRPYSLSTSSFQSADSTKMLLCWEHTWWLFLYTVRGLTLVLLDDHAGLLAVQSQPVLNACDVLSLQ